MTKTSEHVRDNGAVPRRSTRMSAPPQTENAQGRPATLGDEPRRQALFRDLNEEIRRISGSFDVEPLELVCECERGDCFARLSVSHREYESVRCHPMRFLVRVDHVAADERVVEERAGFAVVEKHSADGRSR
jgi:hypothetical protein